MPKLLIREKTLYLLMILFVLPSLALAHVEEGEKHVIRMTDNGFEPQTLTIHEGEEVIFINDDDIDRWPASNLHPTHGLYPEFDPQKSIQPGEMWGFVFDKTGNWRMHDHLIPSLTGVITVVEEAESDEIAEYALSSSSEEGFIGNFLKLLKSFFEKLFGGE